MTNLSHNYQIAIKAHNNAVRRYRAATVKFFAGEMNDEEFGEEQALKVIADAAFDVAFNEEANRPEEADVVSNDNLQNDLF